MELSLSEIAQLVSGEVIGNADALVRGAAAFEQAGSNEITFAMNAALIKKLETCSAEAIIVPRSVMASARNLIRVDNPHAAFAKVMACFYSPARPPLGVSSSAAIGDNFTCGIEPSIAPFVAIGNNVVCGDRVTIHPFVAIGDGVVIGNDVVIYPNTSILERCRIGSRVVIQAGTVIGSDGFGFAPEGEVYHKVLQMGIVQIDDDVEIGAGNTIDRAAFGKTWIQRGVKTDNQVHVAHNVVVGENTLLVAQAGIAGSVTIGRHVIVAGQVGIADHLTIGDNAILGAKTGVGKSVAPGEVLFGAPAMPHKTWLRVHREFPHLPELRKKLDALEKRLTALEQEE
ncbi:MAG: UDP-3-O-(3-hydroxymyristoyl)glucosamine N-acyltransferase [Pseudomonadota bacterium]